MKNSKRKDFPVKNVLIAMAISLLLVFFIAYATNAFYPSPQYSDFCPMNGKVIPTSQTDCEAEGGQWQAYSKPIDGEIDGYCNTYYTCDQEYQTAKDPYERNLFLTNIILGLIIVLVSFLLEFQTVSNGLLGGGLLLLVYGSMRYWSELSDIIRTTMLGIALVSLIWISYKKLNN